jgi:hypothetical protein
MCCYIDETYTKKRIARLKGEGKKYIWGWKQLDMYGGAIYGSYNYNPGINKLDQKQEERMEDYSLSSPSGFHFYLTKPEDGVDSSSGKLVRVRILVNDIHGLESTKTHARHGLYKDDIPRQGVARKIQILKSDWDKAKFYERYWIA